MFRDMGIDMSEILEYVAYVDPIVPALDVPKYPIPKESHLNFLKPGSKEVLTRPVHIHEHLPPLNPPEDEQLYNGLASTDKDIDVVNIAGEDIFKRPADGNLDLSSAGASSSAAKKVKPEEEGRAPRELTSVMMTTSGFISPAREGKAPEARPPNLPPEFTKPIAPPIPSPVFKQKDTSGINSSSSSTVTDKKLEKRLKKKNHDKEKRKDKPAKEKQQPSVDIEVEPQAPLAHLPREYNEEAIMAQRKKALKELRKKQKLQNEQDKEKKKKQKLPKESLTLFDPNFLDKPKFEPSFAVIPPTTSQVQAHNFLTGAAHMYANNPFDSGNLFQSAAASHSSSVEGKLVTEPDRNKLNIFKKISKPKDELGHAPKSTAAERFDQQQAQMLAQTQQQSTETPKKMPKLPKETTMTRVDESPAAGNFSSFSRSNNSSFDENMMSGLPRTPDIKSQPEIVVEKEKKERKKKKMAPTDEWSTQQQQQQHPLQQQPQLNPFMPEANPFLQFANASSLMGNLNPFSLFNQAPGLIPKMPTFTMPQFGSRNDPGGFAGMSGMQMDFQRQLQESMGHVAKEPKPKKVKASKVQLPHEPLMMPMASKASRNLLMQSMQTLTDPTSKLMGFDNNFPFQQKHQQSSMSSFDQLLKEAPSLQKKASSSTVTKVTEPVETFDLTSSPEPVVAPLTLTIQQQPAMVFDQHQPMDVGDDEMMQTSASGVPKEKSKEKKKKKDKDKEERKKVSESHANNEL